MSFHNHIPTRSSEYPKEILHFYMTGIHNLYSFAPYAKRKKAVIFTLFLTTRPCSRVCFLLFYKLWTTTTKDERDGWLDEKRSCVNTTAVIIKEKVRERGCKSIAIYKFENLHPTRILLAATAAAKGNVEFLCAHKKFHLYMFNVFNIITIIIIRRRGLGASWTKTEEHKAWQEAQKWEQKE